jgi:hypothetical protein
VEVIRQTDAFLSCHQAIDSSERNLLVFHIAEAVAPKHSAPLVPREDRELANIAERVVLQPVSISVEDDLIVLGVFPLESRRLDHS